MTYQLSGFKTHRLISKVCVVLLCIAFVFSAKGSYIRIKALVAQHLLEVAWAHSLKTGQPQKPWPWADIVPVARMEIRNQNLSMIILEGVSGEAMAFGPGRIPESSHTLKNGVFAIGGHRDTHFKFLQSIKPGSTISLHTVKGETGSYKTTQRFVANSQNEILSFNTNKRGLALITCYPFNATQTGGPLRLVALAEPEVGEL